MLKDLVLKNRSYRGYDRSRPVTGEELASFVELARQTASSSNIQPLKYRLVFDPEEVARVQAQTRWGGALPELHLPYAGTEPTGFIVICQDTSIHASPTMFLRDVGIVAQTMLLAATEQGLGGCMIGNFNREGILAELSLPEQMNPLLVVAFGKPAEQIVLTDLPEDGRTAYYRDEHTHYVPKRRLEDVLL